MNIQPYRLPNGCDLEIGCRVRIPKEHIWLIPEEDIENYDIELDDGAASFGSEVVYRL